MSDSQSSQRFVDRSAPRVDRTPSIPKIRRGPKLPWNGIVGEIYERVSPSARERMREVQQSHAYRSVGALNLIAEFRERERRDRRDIADLRAGVTTRGTTLAARQHKEILRREIDLKLAELATNDLERQHVAAGSFTARRDLPSEETDAAWFRRELPAMAKASPLAAELMAQGATAPTYNAVYGAKKAVEESRPAESVRDRHRRFPELRGVHLGGSDGVGAGRSEVDVDDLSR